MNTDDTTDKAPPIVLVHGLWMTPPKSWDTWAERFRARGYQVIVPPGWPGIDDRSPPEDVREHPPEALKGIGLKEITDHYEAIIRALPPRKPIIMGHSFGGVITQMLATAASASPTSASSPARPRASPRCRSRPSGPAPRSSRTRSARTARSRSRRATSTSPSATTSPAPSPTRSGRSRPSTPTTGSSSRASRRCSTRRAASRTSSTVAPTAHRSSS